MKRPLALLFLVVAACSTNDLRRPPAPPAGVVRGIVADPSGLGLPGVAVTVANRTTFTDPQGAFVFTAIPPGEYTLVAELSGFSSVQYRVKVTQEQGTAVYATMHLSSVIEQITVTAEAPGYDRVNAYSKFKEHGFLDAKTSA